MEMFIRTKKGEPTFLAILEGGLDWCANDDAFVASFSTMDDADKLGFSEVEYEKFCMLEVGEKMTDFADYEGVHVMRVR